MTNFRLRLLYGAFLLLVLWTLAAAIALGKVEQETSFGLQYILGALSTLTGMFAQWAFGRGKDHDDEGGEK